MTSVTIFKVIPRRRKISLVYRLAMFLLVKASYWRPRFVRG